MDNFKKKSISKFHKQFILNRRIKRRKLETSFTSFFRREASGGILLLVATILALVFANVPALSFLENFWSENITLQMFDQTFEFNFRLIVNDVLMVIFFFVVGLEIKRELKVGELSSIKQASLPIVAAIGGMLAPSLIYALFNYNAGSEATRGWGVPMATDIAFAIGILALLGNRVPVALKVFLTALAIVDDLGAILVIAIFYPTHDIHLTMLLVAGIVFGLLILFNIMRIYSPIPYLLLGLSLWFFILQSGVHATIAGVLLAFTIPSRTDINQVRFYVRAKYLLKDFRESYSSDLKLIMNTEEQDQLQMLSNEIEKVSPLMLRMEHNMHPWVMYVIMPVFALANAGIQFSLNTVNGLFSSISVGIFFGLLIGKPLGIALLSFIAVKFNIACLPQGTKWKQIISLGCLAGIGFTMSIFINGLAFSNPETVEIGKMAILVSSTVAGIIGWLLINRSAPITRNL
ncbi:MAG: Na+/H+ antiporter NhaA [Prevotellaceae bacterium]|jgi:NhaA family Na+:H+ antiporter|nr:Na+/H+ antiporter NhaA [Prevotellaceae bacterium]